MTFFVLAVLIGALAYLVLGKSRLTVRITGVGAILLIVCVGYFAFPQTYLTMGGEDEPWYDEAPFKQAIGLATMIFGMAAKYIFDAISQRREKIRTGDKTARIEFDHWDFLQPFVVSVLVFGSFWKSHGNEVMSVEYLTLGFQSGFFWQAILSPPGAARQKPATNQ